MNESNGNVFNVAKFEHKVLFENEIVGQLSDGAWENYRPNDHWEPWANAQVSVDPENVGRNFYAVKDNYQLNCLIEYIGDRMIYFVKIARLIGPDKYDSLKSEFGFDLPEGTNQYHAYVEKAKEAVAAGKMEDFFVRIVNAWNSVGISDDEINAAEQIDYTETDLRFDLRALRKAMKTRR